MKIEQKLGFDKILELLGQYLNETGRKQLENIKFSTDYDFINTELSSVSEFIDILSNHSFPNDYYFDLTEYLQKLQAQNTYLTTEQLLRLFLSLETLKEIRNFFKRDELKSKFPNLRLIASQIRVYPFILKRIRQVINNKGEILDSASKELKEIRQSLASKKTQISKLVNSILKQAQRQGIVEADVSVAVRGGKFLIPVQAAKKYAIPGIVQDTSATGKTVYIEPLKAVELNNEIIELEFAEKREIIRILIELADDLRPYLPELLTNYKLLSRLDFLRAKALLAIELDAEKPNLVDKPVLDLQNAKHPLLLVNYKKTNRKVVPLSLKIDENQRIILISGPNAGGKSVALKTVGLLQYMVQTGFLVPARFTSTFGIFDKIFADIGDDQSIENDLSTYSSHLLNIKNILEQSTSNSLVLIDEFGAGTDPTFGGAIAEAILEKLLEKKVKAVITTHYSNLKHFAAAHDNIVNGAMLFDSKKLKPLYILELGRPGSSFALEIARTIGLPQDVIDKAKQKIGKNQIDFDKIIRDIEHQRQIISQQRKELEQLKKELRDKVISYRREYEKILRQKHQIISQANKLIENTIRQIKEKKAEKQATKQIRQELNKQLKKLENHRKQLQKQVEKELEENLKKQKKIPQKSSSEIKIGDYVIHKKSGLIGQVQELKDKNALIISGNLKSFFKLNELEKLPPEEQKRLKRQEKKGGVKVEMTRPPQFVSALDVRGLRSDEAIQKVIKFLDAALVAETPEIRILHGTGDGILRKNIRSLLEKTDFVEWFGDADPRWGGSGITIVKFKR